MRMRALLIAACLVTMVMGAGPTVAAEIKVLATPSLKVAMDDLGAKFERATGHKLSVKYATSAVLKRQIEAGEAFDLALLVPASIDDLIKQGKIANGTRADFARSAIGVIVRTGAPKPDVGSAEAFKRVLLAAKSVSYSGEGASGKYFVEMLDKFGIGEEMKPKLRPLPGAAVVEPVAKGEIDIAVITIANAVGVSGAEIAGVLPPDLQHYTVYTAGVSAAASDADAAKAFVKLLLAPEATPVIKASGMERMP